MRGIKTRTNYLYPVILGVIALASIPFLSAYLMHIVILVCMWSFLALGWNIIGGYGGQHSLGNGVYMGIGAYVTSYLALRYGLTPWLGMVVAVLAAAAVGWLMGWVLFRSQLKGAYCALVTLALAELAVYVVSNIQAVGGAGGVVARSDTGWYWMNTTNRGLFYAVAVLMIVAGLVLTQYLSGRRFFYYLQAVRENEDAAEALGVDTIMAKIKANVLSSAWCAVGGVFYAQYFLYVAPRSVFGEVVSIQILLFAIVGGLGTVWGPVLGAALLITVSEVTRAQVGSVMAGADLLIYGLAMVFTMLFMPNGVLGMVKRIRDRYRDHSTARSLENPAVGVEGGDAR